MGIIRWGSTDQWLSIDRLRPKKWYWHCVGSLLGVQNRILKQNLSRTTGIDHALWVISIQKEPLISLPKHNLQFYHISYRQILAIFYLLIGLHNLGGKKIKIKIVALKIYGFTFL